MHISDWSSDVCSSDLYAARVAGAVVDNAVGAGLAQFAGQFDAGHIGVRIVLGGPAAADVVQAGVHAGAVAAHLDAAGRFGGGGEEALAVVHGFLHRGGHAVRGVEHAPCAIGETATFRVEMGDRKSTRLN